MRNDDFRYMRYVGERYFDNRFATLNEIKSKLTPFDFNKTKQEMNSGGTPLALDSNEGYVDSSDTHTLIVGSTGSMKTRAFIVPTIISLGLAGEDMVISDPKGELFEYTSGFLKKHGYQINVLNFRDLEKSHHWNPLHEAYKLFEEGNKDEAKLMLYDIINIIMHENINKTNDQYWPMAGRDFLYGTLQLLLFACNNEEEFNLSSLKGFLSSVYADKDSAISRDFKNVLYALPDISPIKTMLSQVVLNADSTKRGILGHVSQGTSLFLRSEKVNKLVSFNEFDLHDYADSKKKIITYIIVPDEKTSFHFFCSMFVKQLYEVLINEASKKPNRTLERRVNFLLDEFANIPAIPEMSSMISAARSRNIRFFLVLQSNAQLIRKYGPEEAQNIKTNCQTWCFLNSKEMDLIREVQEYIGYDSTSPNKHLISTGELSMLEKKWPKVQSIILMSRARPFLSTLSDFSLYKCIYDDDKLIYPAAEIEFTTKPLVTFDFTKEITNKFKSNRFNFIKDVLQKEGTEISDSELRFFLNDEEEDDDDDDDFFTQHDLDILNSVKSREEIIKDVSSINDETDLSEDDLKPLSKIRKNKKRK